MKRNIEYKDRKSVLGSIRNQCRHDFANIRAVFTNPIVERVDDRQDCGEVRVILLRIINNRVLCIVYTLRGSACRIISAKKADQPEQRIYHQSFARACH